MTSSRVQEIQERNQAVMEALGVYAGRNSWDEPAWCEGCPCGCGAQTATHAKTGLYKFRPGHDAKLASNARQIIRDKKATAEDVLATLRHQEFDGIANKVHAQLLHFPKNGPTRKAARALLKRCGNSGHGDSFVSRYCHRIHQPQDEKLAKDLGRQYGTVHIHETDEDCALSMVLQGIDYHRILFACS